MIIRSFVRLNHKIRVPEIRLNDVDGKPIGIMTTRDAMKIALDKGLDLVEISPQAKPPVCRLMDYGKFRYEQSRKQRDQRKRQHQNAVKEIKFRPNVGDHDYDTKVGHLKSFLEKGHKVKVSLTFRGRENAHRELGFDVVQRVIKDCEDVSNLDMAPKRVGRMVVAMMSPLSKKK